MRSRGMWFVILFLAIIPTFWQLLRPGYFPMQDDQQAFKINQMITCFQDLQIPCRWVPDAGFGYGYPLFNYYPPGVYYLGSLIHAAGFQIIDSVKILFILGFLGAGFTMFIFLRALLDNQSAFVGSILYSYAPYRAQEVYVRGALSEFWASVFFPLIFWSSYMLIKNGGLKYFILLSISIGLLLITHNPLSLIFFPIFIIWCAVVLAVGSNFRAKTVLGLVGSSALGFGLAAFFILPAIVEKSFAHTETMLGGYFDYRQHFVNLQQLFFSNHFGYGSSVWGPYSDLSLSTGIIHWVLGIVSMVVAVITFRKNKHLSLILLVLGILELFVLFMIHEKSSDICYSLSSKGQSHP